VPTEKYRGLGTDPIDGRPIYWSTHPEGYPIRQGDTPALVSKDQLAAASVNLYFRSTVLRIPDQLPDYIQICDWIANGMGVLRFEERRPVPDKPTEWTVWIAWVDFRGYIPSGRSGPTDPKDFMRDPRVEQKVG
jgi:hypothetical protein